MAWPPCPFGSQAQQQREVELKQLAATDERIAELQRLLAEEQGKRAQTVATLNDINATIDAERAKFGPECVIPVLEAHQ